MSQPAPPTRLTSTNPDTNKIAQDLYNKLGQLQAAISALQGEVVTLQAQVKALQSP